MFVKTDAKLAKKMVKPSPYWKTEDETLMSPVHQSHVRFRCFFSKMINFALYLHGLLCAENNVFKSKNMITFGYKNKFGGFLRAVAAIAIGLVMVISRTDAMVLAVRIIAAFLLASGIVSFLIGYRDRQNGQRPLMGVNGSVDILVALLIFIFPQFVAGLIVYLIGFALLGFGIFQLIALVSANKVMKVGVFGFVMPVLVLLAGAFLLARPAFIGTAIGTVAGIALIVYGVSELVSSWKMKQAIEEYDIKFPQQPQVDKSEEPVSGVKDVDYEKVDEQ